MATILIVDDERYIRELVAEVLTDQGHNVLQAGNGREALALLEAETPALVVTDVMMPVLNGIELLQAMKGSAALVAIPVILMTAAERQRAMSAGAAAVLAKPFNLDALDAVVQQCLPPKAR